MKHKNTFPESLPSHVKDKLSIGILKANDFKHRYSDTLYSDYYRIVLGYGATNDDRNEVVTYVHPSHKWLPSAEHVEVNGHVWHIEVGSMHDDLSDAIKWLKDQQATAPKNKE